MSRAARADLESLLQTRRLDHTLTSARPAPGSGGLPAPLATGLSDLDAALGGGFPRGQVSELIGPVSSGRTSVLYRLLARATQEGDLAALVDGLDCFDPVSAATGGIDLPRLLWVRGHVTSHPGFCQDFNPRALTQALAACALVLQAGGFGLVALDLGGTPPVALRRVPYTTWLRLQRMVEGSRTACVLLGDTPMARSTAGLSLRLRPAADRPGSGAPGRWLGADRSGGPDAGRARLFEGLAIDVQVVQARARWTDDRGCVVETVMESGCDPERQR
ncbi:MAG TPA: hypothetical protein VNE16_08980 [Vicinamibacterales bacterium]|nr:hypothetical protein [Vicinamibacterales bacterium]